MQPKRDIILIIEGGAMTGFFCAGVISAFEKANIYDRIHSVYGVSAGAQMGAYFLSKKIIRTSELYTDELLSKRHTFIKKLSLKEIFKKLFDLIVFRRHMHIMDLEVLKSIQRTRNKINTRVLKNMAINFYVKIFDTKNLTFRYMDGKRNTLETINISSHLPPYIYQKTRYTHYFDGELVPNNEFVKIIKENPNKQIIYILNEKRTRWYSFVEIPIKFIHFLFKSRFFGLDFASYYLVHFFDKPSINKLEKFPNTFVVYPNMNIRKISTKEKKLKKLYNEGVKEGSFVLKFLDKENLNK